MAIENVELMHECSPKHFSMGTGRMKEAKETEDVCRPKNCEYERKWRRHEINNLKGLAGSSGLPTPGGTAL